MSRLPDPDHVRRETQRVGRSALDGRRVSGAAADLSPAAIAARRSNRTRGGREGGATGRELIRNAGGIFGEAQRLRKVADRRTGARARRAGAKADEALRTAAAQIRLASVCPLDRGYLHALSIEQIQTAKAEAGQAFEDNPAALAVDTYQRIQEQRLRMHEGD